MKVYFKITNNCNLKCDHCCFNSGPGGETMCLKDIKKVINNLPPKLEDLDISGGEVFTRKKVLYETLDYITKKLPGLKELTVQTNGFWAINPDIVKRTLEELIELNVDGVDVTSRDRYHTKAGLDQNRPKLLAEKAKEKDFIYRGNRIIRALGIFPQGRALNLDKKYWRSFNHTGDACRTKDPAINEKGQVYPCCWMNPRQELGDVKKESLNKIVKRVYQRKAMQTLLEPNGHIKLAREAGLTRKDLEEIPEYQKSGRCGLCSYLFRENIVTL